MDRRWLRSRAWPNRLLARICTPRIEEAKMKHPFTHVVTVAAGLTVIGVLGAAGLVSAQTKEARGNVTAISNSSMTVAVGKENMTFVIDSGTKVEVKAAAKKSREANSTNSPGITITEYIKTGNPVLVRYR